MTFDIDIWCAGSYWCSPCHALRSSS